MSPSSAVEGANSGRAAEPARSLAARLLSPGGRATVVLAMTMPSMPLGASATAAMSARLFRTEIGRDLDQQRRLGRDLVAGGNQTAQQIVEDVAALQVAQPRSIRRRHVDHKIICEPPTRRTPSR